MFIVNVPLRFAQYEKKESRLASPEMFTVTWCYCYCNLNLLLLHPSLSFLVAPFLHCPITVTVPGARFKVEVNCCCGVVFYASVATRSKSNHFSAGSIKVFGGTQTGLLSQSATSGGIGKHRRVGTSTLRFLPTTTTWESPAMQPHGAGLSLCIRTIFKHVTF